MTLNRKSQGQGHRERSQLRRSHQGLFPCKVSSLYWLMWPRTNLNAEVNQNVDGQTDGRTDRHHQSISWNCFTIQPKMTLCHYVLDALEFGLFEFILISNIIQQWRCLHLFKLWRNQFGQYLLCDSDSSRNSPSPEITDSSVSYFTDINCLQIHLIIL